MSDPATVSCELICVACTPPIFARGEVTTDSPESPVVKLEKPESALTVGLHVVLMTDSGTRRLLARVQAIDGTTITLSAGRPVATDKRVFPRFYGGIRLRFKNVPAESWETVSADWMAGKGSATGDDWQKPDPFMDFSVSGLKFEGRDCKPNDTLLMEIRLGSERTYHRATARVVRIDPVEADHRRSSNLRLVAVQFVDLPKAAAEAFVSFTLRLQELLL